MNETTPPSASIAAPALHIWVDADACPVVIKDILFRAAERTLVPVTLVVVLIVAIGARVTPDRSINAVIISVANIAALFVTLGIVGRSLRRDVERRKAALPGSYTAQV
jgi:hypothetical protein